MKDLNYWVASSILRAQCPETFSPTTCIHTAMSVVEAIGTRFYLERDYTPPAGDLWFAMFGDDLNSSATAATAPLAICIAARAYREAHP